MMRRVPVNDPAATRTAGFRLGQLEPGSDPLSLRQQSGQGGPDRVFSCMRALAEPRPLFRIRSKEPPF
ncbi:hypothetical protein PUNSTDRAFT_50449 [Punctularia strigosozonata HHB-11173 SS5]|uniref:uncharacterized protein n=1 Tax=Punctularia strigosozonata (strain HHB-11173) TaxID=741275 RepID=UPI0004417F58|nr:uncharacterized protein PUNSTDRAFT_50449 [Punctularia strigosozonata HHB-11173 SS5]EIN11470.1 hypothetical protein PUNSTDRAFT_50449 [Punctularia strigosozonata HHB-11173 SS5]